MYNDILLASPDSIKTINNNIVEYINPNELLIFMFTLYKYNSPIYSNNKIAINIKL